MLTDHELEEHVEKLELKDDDILILYVPETYSPEQMLAANRFMEPLARRVGKMSVVLPNNLTLTKVKYHELKEGEKK